MRSAFNFQLSIFKNVFLASLLLLSTFFILPNNASASIVDCGGAPHICSLDWSNKADPAPGQKCSTDGDHYVFGTTTNCPGGKSGTTCVPKCGIWGNGWCCDPNPQNPPSVTPMSTPGQLQPPPCTAGKLDPQKGCLSVDTAFGRINTNVGDVTNTVFRLLLSISGGVAILLIIGAGFQMMTSQGNPEKVKEARERLTSAIVGLLFIIFSVAILQIIGVDILQIPGFTR